MKITIAYLLKNEEEFRQLNLSPNEYFDSNYIEEGEMYEFDSIPLYENPCIYIKESKEKIIQLKLYIQKEDKIIERFYTFWNAGNCYLIKNIEITDKKKFEEIIICTSKIDEKEPFPHLERHEVLRIRKDDNNFLVPVVHGISYNLPEDGTEIEKIIDKGNFSTANILGWE